MFGQGPAKRQKEAQSFLLRLLNERGLAVAKSLEDRRLERRTNLSLGVWVVPLGPDGPIFNEAFTAITKDFGTAGIGLLTNHPIATEEVLVRLRSNNDARFLKAQVANCTPLGAGWFLFGLQVVAMVYPDEYLGINRLELAAT